MTSPDEHKVRGGSALSLALSKISPNAAALSKSSPADSASSNLSSHHTPGWLSSATGSPLAAASPPPASDALAHSTSPSQAERKQHHQQQHHQQHHQQQHQHQRHQQHHQQQQQRRRIPFLSSCFSAPGTVFGDEGGVRPLAAVSASEVGIRPCFYWLEDPAMSEEDRMFAEANARWLKSDCQDDAVVIEHFCGQPHQTFAGVFDGHGPYGRHAAKLASTRLPQLLAPKLTAAGSERKRLRALKEAFLEVNAAMRDSAAAGFDASLSGTTACCAVVVGRRVLVASSGDSRCMVARRAPNGELEAVPLTWDAKPSLPEEQQRIVSSGGVVKQLLDERGQRVGAYRVFRRGDDVLPGLAMSRSLGDLYAHAVGVSAEPILNTYTLGDRDLFLILATDGLWDVMDNAAVADFVQRYRELRQPHLSCAEALTLEAQERWKALHDEAIVDDICCVILHTAGLPPPLSAVDEERSSSVPRVLARAASCNDEANDLYMQWRLERDCNPSNHKPQQYFKHLYGEEDKAQDSDDAMPTSNAAGKEQAAVTPSQQAPQAPPTEEVAASAPAPAPASESAPIPTAADAAADAEKGASVAGSPPAAAEGCLEAGAPPPPGSPFLRDAPQYARPLHRSDSSSASLSATAAVAAEAAAAAVPPPRVLHSPVQRHVELAPLQGPASPREPSSRGMGRGSSGVLLRMDDFSSMSPHSSYGDLGSEHSEHSTRRGTAYAAWQELHAPLARHSSSGPQPIPVARKGGMEEGAMSLPLEAMLRPVRKAYPSNSNFQAQLGSGGSHCSDASLATATDSLPMPTPHSGEQSQLERKVHGGMSRSLSGGMSRSLSAHRLQGSCSHSHSYASVSSLSHSHSLGHNLGHNLGQSYGYSQSHGYGQAFAMLASSRASADMLSGLPAHQEDGLGSSGTSCSPSGDSLLGGALSPGLLSPQASPLVVPLGGGYSQLQGQGQMHSQPQHGNRLLPPGAAARPGASLEYGKAPAAAGGGGGGSAAVTNMAQHGAPSVAR